MYKNEEFYLDKRIVKTKKKIKKTLLSLLKSKSFEKITIADLVHHAEISRVTFYNHYHNKEDLLNEFINDVLQELIASYRIPYQSLNIFTLEQINPSMIMVFEHVYSNADFYSTVANSDISMYLQNRMIEVLKRLTLKDFSMLNPNINNELYAEWYAYAIYGLIIEWIKKGYPYSPKYMAEQLLELARSVPNKRVKRKNLIKL